jgi:hypothetical protein
VPDSLYHRLFHLRVVCKPQVIIAAEADDLSVIDDHLYLLRAFCYAASAVTKLLLSLGECFTKVFQTQG